MRTHQRHIAFVAAWLLVIILAAPVAADDNGAPMSDNDREMGAACSQNVFRVMSDADVNIGSIVGGPYSGFPIVVVSDPGKGLPLDTPTPIPTTLIPLPVAPGRSLVIVGDNVGLGVNAPPVPAFAQFPLLQRVPSNGTFGAERGTLLLLVRPAIITYDSCR